MFKISEAKITEPMGFQKLAETAAKTATNDVRDSVAGVIKEQLDRKYFDFYEPSLVEAFQNLGEGQAENLLANINKIPFKHFFDHKNGKIKEFLASSGTTGIAGAYYLIPVKLFATLQTEAVETDIVGDISAQLLGPSDVSPGTTMKVDIVKDGQYGFSKSSSGAIAPTETLETVQTTLNFTPIYTLNIRLANDLEEDANWPLMELHVREAGRQAGEQATNLALTVLRTGSTGADGTINPITGDAGYTLLTSSATTTDVRTAILENAADGYKSDTMVTTYHSWWHKMWADGLAAGLQPEWMTNPYPDTVLGLRTYRGSWTSLNYVAGTFTRNYTLVFTKQYALLSGRKRWLRIEQYSEPVRDLKGAVVSFRQDSVTMYNDSIALLTEA